MANVRNAAVQRQKGASNQAASKSMEGRVHSVSGSVELSTTGEATVDVNFPVIFVERPNFTFGGGVLPGSVLTDGSFPRINGAVVAWQTQKANDSLVENVRYTGVTLSIVSYGTQDQRFFLDFRFEGVALVNPVGGVNVDDLDDEL